MTRLCDLSSDANTVTSVSWSERGNQVAVGTHHGYVTVWDVAVNKQVNLNIQNARTHDSRRINDPSVKVTNKGGAVNCSV